MNAVARCTAAGATLGCALAGSARAQVVDAHPIDTALARGYFQEAAAVAQRDAGALWGVPLEGPLIFGDQATRSVVAERGDTAGILHEAGSVWVGTIPADRNVANTAQEWGGVRWITIRWPPPQGEDAEARARRAELFAHEMWHGIQGRLGVSADDPPNAHLDEREGRLWLRLEARALRHALARQGDERTRALRDALRFRGARHARFEGSSIAEGKLERHEGMASYTGLRLSGRDSTSMTHRARDLLAVLDSSPHLARSFAYGTGPAYGLLLDDAVTGWRERILEGAAPAALLADALGMRPAPRDVVGASRYGYDAIVQEEAARERERMARRAELTARLVDGPVLRLPFEQMQMQIDPQHVEPLGTAGTVYRTIRIADKWGVLDAKDGAVLIAPDFSYAAVALPKGAEPEQGVVRGEGWMLTLSEGYRLRKGARSGDLTAGR